MARRLLVTAPDGTVVGDRQTPRPYTHAIVCSVDTTWSLLGYALTEHSAVRRANKWLETHRGVAHVVPVSEILTSKDARTGLLLVEQ